MSEYLKTNTDEHGSGDGKAPQYVARRDDPLGLKAIDILAQRGCQTVIIGEEENAPPGSIVLYTTSLSSIGSHLGGNQIRVAPYSRTVAPGWADTTPYQIGIHDGRSCDKKAGCLAQAVIQAAREYELWLAGKTDQPSWLTTAPAGDESSRAYQEWIGKAKRNGQYATTPGLHDTNIERGFQGQWKIEVVEKADMGSIQTRRDIPSTIEAFSLFPECKVRYPEVVVDALGDLYAEYNLAFGPLVKENREWGGDYRYCLAGPNEAPVNYFAQIDMAGLPRQFLEKAGGLGKGEVRGLLRGRVFEIENSLAMYNLLRGIFSRNGQDSNFKRGFDESLDRLRQMHGMPIALLAVTDEKYQAMRATEFGKTPGQLLTDAEVKKLSGFDTLFGPIEFEKHLRQNGGESKYLLYVRASDPLSRMRHPNAPVECPLLEDEELRKIIKEHAITLNIDSPYWDSFSPRGINDTKAYLLPMGMAWEINGSADFRSEAFLKFLLSQGVNLEQIESGQVILRGKPERRHYGCYGHIIGRLGNRTLTTELTSSLRERGPYVVQPEKAIPIITDAQGKGGYVYIDRVFFSTDGTKYRFLGGFRNMMPLGSQSVRHGRIHGAADAVFAEIT